MHLGQAKAKPSQAKPSPAQPSQAKANNSNACTEHVANNVKPMSKTVMNALSMWLKFMCFFNKTANKWYLHQDLATVTVQQVYSRWVSFSHLPFPRKRHTHKDPRIKEGLKATTQCKVWVIAQPCHCSFCTFSFASKAFFLAARNTLSKNIVSIEVGRMSKSHP